MASSFLALASGPAFSDIYYLNMKRMPATFPHWTLYIGWFFCYLVALVVLLYKCDEGGTLTPNTRIMIKLP